MKNLVKFSMKYHIAMISKRMNRKVPYGTFNHDDKPMFQVEKEEEKNIVKI